MYMRYTQHVISISRSVLVFEERVLN